MSDGNPSSRHVALSRRLSLVLRLRPDTVGVQLDPAGWCDISALLDGMAAHGWPLTRAELDAVVEGSDKQRFALDGTGERIRASQGHTVPVDLDLPATPPPDVLWHGTHSRALDGIQREGLRRMRRHHVHLTTDPDVASRTGTRRGVPVVFRVAAAAQADGGWEFRVTPNGVWLVDAVPVKYLTCMNGAEEAKRRRGIK